MRTNLRRPVFKPAKTAQADWDNFRGGLNTFFRQTEIKGNELSKADNLMLVGEGVPTKRWGSQNYMLAAATGYGRGLYSAKSVAGSVELLAITDWGILSKKNGASYTEITGASWPSGYNVEMTQLDNRVYLASQNRELARYDFTNLTNFPTLTTPDGVQVSNYSGATGSNTYSWRITAVSQVGETLGSTAVSMASLPQDLSDTMIRLQWTPVSAASGVLKGYNIYRGSPGDETWLAAVDNDTTIFFDVGIDASLLNTVPSSDTTGGPKCKYIVRYQDRLVMAGLDGDPTKVLISGRVPYHEKFDWSTGGGWILIDPDSGDVITGLAVHQDKIIVFKEKSVWQVTLGTVQIGNFTILNPSYQLITASQGCSSHRSIVAVDNDLLFCNTSGVYVLGYEPNILNVLRTNELSAKVRPFFDTITNSDFQNSTAAYINRKYIIAFPTAKKALIFDRERAAFMGPWTTSFGINQLTKHIDSNGVERWLAIDSDDTYVTEFSPALTDDKGTAFRTVFKTKKEDFGDWSIFKTINEAYLYLRNVFGSADVNIYLEERSGLTKTAKTFSITTTQTISGWGTDQWGLTQWGLSNNDAKASSEEVIKRALLYKTARTFQVEIITSNKADSYELLGIKSFAVAQGRGGVPSSWAAT